MNANLEQWKDSTGTSSSMLERNKWTVMIYHSGDAYLGPDFVCAMKEIDRVGVPVGVEVVAIMDSVAPTPYVFNIKAEAEKSISRKAEAEKTTGSPRKRLFGSHGIGIPLDEDNVRGKKPRAVAPNETDFASGDFLAKFVTKTVKEHQADHYLLILSGHGSGIIGNTLLRDQGSSSFMTIPALDRALRRSTERSVRSSRVYRPQQPIDILGFDACCMMTAEVAHSLRGEVSHIVGSEGFMTLNGWPYHEILQSLRQNPGIEPPALAREIVRRCVEYYSDFSRVGTSIDLASCDLNPKGWAKLTEAIRILAKTLRTKIDEEWECKRPPDAVNSIIAAHWYAQSYGSEQYVDLYDFCKRLAETAPAFSEEADAVADAVASMAKSCYAGADFQDSHGLSLYFPWAATDKELRRYRYNSETDGEPETDAEGERVTEFEELTGWGQFLEFFTKRTRRDRRGVVRDPKMIVDVPPQGFDRDDHRTGTIVNTRNGTIVNTRNGTIVNTKGEVVFPKVKNPALSSVEDECEQ